MRPFVESQFDTKATLDLIEQIADFLAPAADVPELHLCSVVSRVSETVVVREEEIISVFTGTMRVLDVHKAQFWKKWSNPSVSKLLFIFELW